jgi:hypothetical protein
MDLAVPDGTDTQQPPSPRLRILMDASGDVWIEDTSDSDGMWLCLTDPDALAALRYIVHELTRKQIDDVFGPTWLLVPDGTGTQRTGGP